MSTETLVTDTLFVTALLVLTAIASFWIIGLSAVTAVVLLLTVLERHAQWKKRPKRRGNRFGPRSRR